MKPNNLKDKNCESKSSDCVSYDAKLPTCMDYAKFCEGGPLTDALDIIAKQVCAADAKVNFVFDISHYQLTAMEAEFGPVGSLKDLIQNLINKAYPPA